MKSDDQLPFDGLFGDVVFRYTTEDAVADGVLVPTGYVKISSGRSEEVWPVYFTRTLWEDGYNEEARRRDLIEQGLRLLRGPDPEDSDAMRLRVIDPDTWVIAEPGKITYIRPEDY